MQRTIRAALAVAIVALPVAASAQKVIQDYPPMTSPGSSDTLLLQPGGGRTNPYRSLTLQNLLTWIQSQGGGGTCKSLLNQAGQPILNQSGQQILVGC